MLETACAVVFTSNCLGKRSVTSDLRARRERGWGLSENPAEQEKPIRDDKGRFPPGVSGNPRGRGSAKYSIREWYDVICQATEAELKAISADKGAPKLKRSAADAMLAGGMDSLNHFLDRVIGKPRQVVEAVVDVPKEPGELARRLRDEIGGGS